MDLFKKIKDYLNTQDKSKTISNMAILVLVGILLVIASGLVKNPSTQTFKTNNNGDGKTPIKSISSTSVTREYELARENELIGMLESMSGVGRVKVKIYCESGEEEVPATNSTSSVSETTENPADGGSRVTKQQSNGSTVVMINQGGENSPTIVKKYNPKVTGVFIVAEGAEEKTTERQIKFAVMKLFNLLEEKVTVLPMKK